MLTAYLFMAINFTGYGFALARGPFWGILVYINIYFNSPNQEINWWFEYLPDIRWSLVTTTVILVSIIIHRNSMSKCKLHSIKWAIAFLLLTGLIILKGAVVPEDAKYHLVMLLSYCMTAYFIIRGVISAKQYRLMLITVIVLAGSLSLKAYIHGERINARLENIGTVDTLGSNGFALLLAGIVPLALPFIIKGNKYERIICFFSLPFILNALVLCNSRGAFVAMALSVALVFTFMADWKLRKTIMIIVFCAVPIFAYLADEYMIERISSLIGVQDAVSDEAEIDKVSSGRIEIWKHGLNMVKDYPLGAGPNSFKQLARFYIPEALLTFHPGAEYGVRAAHNTYLQILVEQGIAGLCIFLIMCAHTMILIYKSLKRFKKAELTDQFWKYNIVALGLSYSSILFGGLFSSRVYYEFFWWQTAFVVVAYSIVMEMDQYATDNLTEDRIDERRYIGPDEFA